MKHLNRPGRSELLTLAQKAGQNLPDPWSSIVDNLDIAEKAAPQTLSGFRFRAYAHKWVLALNAALFLIVGIVLLSLVLQPGDPSQGYMVKNFLSESRAEIRFNGLDWNLSKQQVIDALGLQEGTYTLKQEVDVIWINAPAVLFDIPGIHAKASYHFAQDQLFSGGYVISGDTVNSMITAVSEIIQQIDDLGMNEQFHGPSGGTLEYLKESSLRYQMEHLSFDTNFTWRADNGNRLTLALVNAPDATLGFVVNLRCSSS